jgi:hypothetical protein
MALNVTITVDEAAMRKARDALRDVGGDALARAVADAVAKQAVLPETRAVPAQSGKPQPFTSNAQRRAFFAKLKSGAIKVPYQRTGQLVAGWRQADAFTVENSTQRAAFVVTAKTQAKYHKGNWPTEADIAAKVQSSTAEPTATGAVVEWIAQKGLA